MQEDQTGAGPEGGSTDAAGSDAPRLPARPALVEFVDVPRYSDDVPQLVRSVAAPARAGLTPFGLDPSASTLAWQDYEEPELVESWKFAAALLALRVVAFGWAAWLVLAARSMQTGGITDAGLDSVISRGRIGFVVTLLVATVSSALMVLRTVNVHRLDGRLPSRTRCVLAWLAPLVVVALASLLILYVPPTEPADVRPFVAVVAFLLAMWRPYSLVRRILASLTPATSNPLLGVSFVLDVAGFGVLWWQLLAWAAADEVSDGRIDVLVAIGSVNALAILAGVAAWFLILMAMRRAQRYRRRALRTRHTHRMLRLQGIDPLDADVWWAMVHGRLGQVAAPPAEAGAAAAAAPSTPDVWTPTVVPPDEVVDVRPDVAARGAVDERPPVEMIRVERSDAVVDRVDDRSDAGSEIDDDEIDDDDIDGRMVDDGDDVDTGYDDDHDDDVDAEYDDDLDDEDEDEHEDDDVDVDVDAEYDDDLDEDDDLVGDDPDDALDAEYDEYDDDEYDDDEYDDDVDAEYDDDLDDDDDDEDDGDLDAEYDDDEYDDDEASTRIPLADRLSEVLDTGIDVDAEDERLLEDDEFVVDGEQWWADDEDARPLDDDEREDEYQYEYELDDEDRDEPGSDGETEPIRSYLIPQRLVALDLARLLIVAGYGVATIAVMWMLDQSLRAHVNGEFGLRSDRIDSTRLVMLIGFAAANAVTPLWVGVLGRHLRLARIDDIGVRRWFVAAGIGLAGAVGLALIGQDASEIAVIGLIELPAAVGALSAAMVIRLERSMRVRITSQLVWAITTPVVFVIIVSGRLASPIGPDDSLVNVMFFGALLALAWLLLLVIVALSTRDFHDELRRLAGGRRRRRR